jgi:hypothetical protein
LGEIKHQLTHSFCGVTESDIIAELKEVILLTHYLKNDGVILDDQENYRKSIFTV